MALARLACAWLGARFCAVLGRGFVLVRDFLRIKTILSFCFCLGEEYVQPLRRSAAMIVDDVIYLKSPSRQIDDRQPAEKDGAVIRRGSTITRGVVVWAESSDALVALWVQFVFFRKALRGTIVPMICPGPIAIKRILAGIYGPSSPIGNPFYCF